MIKLLVKNILRASVKEPKAYDWSVQGLGMMRLYLSDEVRLHVWDSALKVPGASPIHSHPWDLDSLIVAGVLRQERYLALEDYRKKYNCEPASVSPGGHFSRTIIKCGEGAAPTAEVKATYLLEMGVESYREGERYTQTKDELHFSFPEDGTTTLVTRTFSADRDHATVCWRGSGPFISAEPRAAYADEVRNVAARALASWF